ncbi:VWA domain-containing protein [Williamsia sp. 1135]|uniref:VWA domain-containing protein n=1 Tax=Williamsia sp. 1135 TaxID=1889262 RepID=UPI000A11CE0F|nr:VWA domain-containing protein [Williamsia sp. 1135]ORM37145.1 hypothetical protein BFL43_05120 [Williamsia sp. 1135]
MALSAVGRGRPRVRALTLLLVLAVLVGMCGPYPSMLGGVPIASAAPDPSPAPASSGPVPIVIVFDLSSSMTETDGAGTVKLSGAKRSLKALVDRQPPNTEMGLWTYPTAADSCSPGGFVYGSGLQNVADPSTLSATIDGLSANGGTPTGDALRSAADAVRDQGRTAATFVLVSDGESNCDTDPCDVAKSISAEGFDITVQAMGFQISDAGREELECIAEATQGAYYDVADSDELSAKLSELSVPAIDVAVTAAATAPSGGMTTLSAVVTNTSAQTIEDVMVGLQFKFGDDGKGILPAVIPPRFRLGTLAPGATATRSWDVSTTARGVAGTMNWSVGAWGATTLPVRKSGTITVTDDLEAAAGGDLLKGITTSDHPALVMGDSFSSGEGTRQYLGKDNDHSELCHRSDTQYVSQLMATAKNKNVTNIACSGAIMVDLISPQLPDKEPWRTSKGQIQMLDKAKAPSAVFMTMGGNDISFGPLATSCITSIPVPGAPGCDEDEEIRKSVNDGMVVLNGLDRYYTNIFRTANSNGKRNARKGAVAPVIVVAYPEVTPPSSRARGCTQIGLDYGELTYINETVRALNTKIRDEVNEAWDKGSEVYFASTTANAFMPDHTICDSDPYANPPSVDEMTEVAEFGVGAFITSSANGRLNELVHPNVNGHGALAASIVSWSTQPELTKRPAYDSVPAPTFNLSGGHQEPDQRMDVSTNQTARNTIVVAGDVVETVIKEATLGRFRPIRWLFRSEPQLLATGYTAEDGSAAATIVIPENTPSGIHHLTITSTGADGQPWTNDIEIRVKAPMPWWYWGLAGATGLCVLGALVALWRARRFR